MDRSANYLMHAASKAIRPEVWTLREQDIKPLNNSSSTYGNSIVYNNGIYWQIITNYWGTWQENQPIVRYSSDLKSWTTVTITVNNWGTSTGLSTLGVAASGNTIIVVGGSSNGSIHHRIWRSDDNGTTWTTVKSSASYTADAYYKIIYANDLWLAISPRGMSVSSDDGLTWTDYASTTQGPYGNIYNCDKIVYANGLWLAPGSNGKFYTHSTLTSSTWSEYTVSTAGTNAIKSVEYINGIYVASYGSSITYSNDLTTWSAATGITLPSYSDSNLKNILRITKFSVDGTTERLVAAGYPNKIHYSDNGSSWTSVDGIYYTPSFTLQSYQATFISDFVVGPKVVLNNSVPVAEWILGADTTNNYTFTGPGFASSQTDPDLYLVRGKQYRFTNTMGQHPFRIQSTPNGSVGTQYDNGITNNNVSNGTLIWDVQSNTPNLLYYQCTVHPNMGGKIYIIDEGVGPNNTIVYVDRTGALANSSNAISWTVINNFSTWADIVYNPISSKFFGVKMVGSPLLSSSNGLNWTFETPIQGNTTAATKKIKFSSTWQYGVTHMVDGGRWTSDYGNTWNYFSEFGGYATGGTTPNTGYLSCVVWTGQYFYLLGYTTFKRILPSLLGGSWSTSGPSFMSYDLVMDAESDGLGGIVVIPRTTGVLVCSSNHGNTWFNTNNPSWQGSRQPMGTAYSPTLDMLITVGEYDYIARSTDNGSNWTWPSLTGQRIYYCATWTGSRFVVGGYGYSLNSIYAASRAISTDGVTWTQDNFGLASDYMYDIETNSDYSATIGVCGGQQYSALVSTDQGVSWTSYNMPSNPGSICFITNSTVISVSRTTNFQFGDVFRLLRSTNTGQTWSIVYTDSNISTITPAPGFPGYGSTCMRPVINGDASVVIVFCRNQSTTQIGVLVSTDQGSTWSLYYISGLYGAIIQAYWNGTQFIAHTNIGRQYTSTNGVNWTEGVLPTTAYFPPPKDFVIKRGSPASTTRIWSDQDSRGYSSDNGVTWQSYNNIYGWSPRRIIWDGSRYIIITYSSTYIFTATNPATSWTPISNVTIPGNSTIGGNLVLVSISYNSVKAKYYIGAIDNLTKITYILSSSDLTSWSVKYSAPAVSTTAVELHAGAYSPTRSIMAGNYSTLVTYP